MSAAVRAGTCALALAVAACAPVYWIDWQSPIGRTHPLAGKIFDVRADGFISPRELVDRLAASRWVLLGERHDNPDHHALQARLVRALAAAGRRPALGFEMLSTDQSAALARHLARAPKDAAGLGTAVGWQDTGWPDWADYQPIARAALDAGLPIVATNLSRAALDAMRDRGVAGLGPAVQRELGLDQPLPPAMRAALAGEIRDSHCGHAPAAVLDRMVDVQWARDARMAESLARAGRRDGAILIAGSGHVRRDRGVPVHLVRREPGATVASLAFLEIEAKGTTPGDYLDAGERLLPYDYVWFTPRIDDVDPCEKFKKSLERLKKS